MSEASAKASLLESRGTSQQLDAFVVAACFDRAGGQVAFGLGDGTVRLVDLRSREEWRAVEAHEGAVLTLAAAAGPVGFVSGGDDGQFLRLGGDGETGVIAGLGSKWVEQALSFWDGKAGFLACSAGKLVHVFEPDGTKIKVLEHPSTVTGLATDGRGKRLAASHYNGASLWFVASKTALARPLHWKGSHTGIAVHPAAEAVVTAMQENALHGWRLPDEHDMRMSGYPAKPESLSFTRTGRYLASSGADAVVLWPFFGGGPMGKAPLELAQMPEVICTRVACHPRDDVVAAGFADGSVVLAEIGSRRVLRVAHGEGHGAVSALCWSQSGGDLAFGTEGGFAALVNLSAA